MHKLNKKTKKKEKFVGYIDTPLQLAVWEGLPGILQGDIPQGFPQIVLRGLETSAMYLVLQALCTQAAQVHGSSCPEVIHGPVKISQVSEEFPCVSRSPCVLLQSIER